MPTSPRSTTRTLRRSAAVTLTAGLALVGLTACGDDSSTDSATDATTTSAAAPTTAASDLTVTDAWARTSPSSVTTGAAYLTITGGATDDELTDVSVPATVAGMAQIHEMVPAGEGDGMTMTTEAESGGDMSSTTMGDMATTTMADSGATPTTAPAMVMQEVESIPVPAGEQVELKPGGYHIMLMELAAPLKAGDTFDLTLTFKEAGEMTVKVTVKDEA